jgi:hypothetical protein
MSKGSSGRELTLAAPRLPLGPKLDLAIRLSPDDRALVERGSDLRINHDAFNRTTSLLFAPSHCEIWRRER